MNLDPLAADLADLGGYGPDDPLDPNNHRPTRGEILTILLSAAAISALFVLSAYLSL